VAASRDRLSIPKQEEWPMTCAHRRALTIAVLLLGLALVDPGAGASSSGTPATVPVTGGRHTSFDDGWRFHKGEAEGAEQPGFDDTTWRELDLPHDWAIEGPFAEEYGPPRGALPFFGTGWYRKRFVLPAQAAERYYAIEFDGAMANSRVWLNGVELGGRPYGYIGFSFDLTPHLRFGGEENVLAVRLTPEDQSSRWYPGAGIYRHVWLETTGPIHVARWGTFVTTPEVRDERATVHVRTEIRNRRPEAARIALETAVFDADGREVGRVVNGHVLAAAGMEEVEAEVDVARPERWELDRPYLHRLVSTIREGDRVLDRYVTRFGIRTIALDREKGFLLNERPIRFRGVCLHHDLGALGTAVNRRATERQLQIMKTMGANAIRTSHNPPSPEPLELADELGLLVMDEAFDMWAKPKVENGHGKYFDEWGERDLRDMIRRDRNHPSVVMWSIGNEILEQADEDGWKTARRLTAICHEEDPTRPVTAGFNQIDNAIRNGLVDEVDVAGFNYGAPRYEEIMKAHAGWMVLGAETASTVSSRGVYHLPVEKYEKHPSHQVSSYDIIAPRWGYPPDVEFAAQERLPRVLGEFVWTGFDYLGEPTPYYLHYRPYDPSDWPARSSYFGIVDLAGFPKDRYFLYQSQWTSEPMVHLLPHWNWEGHEGESIPVYVYTNADEAELFLNDTSLGRKRRGAELVAIPVGERTSQEGRVLSPYRMVWSVPWQPGTLRAVAFRGGRPVATEEVTTAGPPARITLSPDRTELASDGRDLSFVTVRIEDEEGHLCPRAENLVRFSVDGAGRRAAVDNGNPATVEPFQADERRAFGGLALLIVQSEKGRAGPIRVTARSEGLRPAEATLSAFESPESREP
jgi:beta-galactosidase